MSNVPSVGRIVHYQPHGSVNSERLPEPYAAIITEVFVGRSGTTIGTVGLCILTPRGFFFNETTPQSETPKPGYWSWMPEV